MQVASAADCLRTLHIQVSLNPKAAWLSHILQVPVCQPVPLSSHKPLTAAVEQAGASNGADAPVLKAEVLRAPTSVSLVAAEVAHVLEICLGVVTEAACCAGHHKLQLGK